MEKTSFVKTDFAEKNRFCDNRLRGEIRFREEITSTLAKALPNVILAKALANLAKALAKVILVKAIVDVIFTKAIADF